MEQEILKQFLFNKKLKFNEIEKGLKVRSNKLSYHLKSLVKKQILEKKDEQYFLSETAENLIPYLSDKKSTLPVILIQIGNKNNVFLHKRKKRPFKDFLSLPGGRLLIKESPEQAAKRIMENKFNIKIEKIKIKSISLEHVKKSNKILHSFLLILIQAKTKDNIELTNVNKNKLKITSSDYKLIKQEQEEIKIKKITTIIK